MTQSHVDENNLATQQSMMLKAVGVEGDDNYEPPSAEEVRAAAEAAAREANHQEIARVAQQAFEKSTEDAKKRTGCSDMLALGRAAAASVIAANADNNRSVQEMALAHARAVLAAGGRQ